MIRKLRTAGTVAVSAALLSGAVGVSTAAAGGCDSRTEYGTTGFVCSDDIAVDAGTEFSGRVATYGVSGPYASVVQFSGATIDWGDGSPLSTGSTGGGEVYGTHTYGQAGTYTIRTTTSSNQGGLSSTGTGSVTEPTHPFITGSGSRGAGSSFTLDVRRKGWSLDLVGTASFTDGGKTVSGDVTCASIRFDGKDRTFGKRAVIGIKTNESKPRYLEYYVQDWARHGDRIVQTGTTAQQRRGAPPAGCYHAAPLALNAKHRIADGDIAVADVA